MPKKSRLKKGYSKLTIQKPRGGRLKKFQSYTSLRDYMAGIGGLSNFTKITDMELTESRRAGFRITPQEAKDRILMWWNTPMDAPDAISHRPSYVMMYMLKKAVRQRERGK